jgi:Trk K+ transport system NAD-binding subunit
MGPLGRRVAELLIDLNRPVVGISGTELDPGLLPYVRLITGDPRESLKKANSATAASVVVLTDDDVANLELALMAARINPNCNLVIRTDDDEFGRNARALAPHTQAMSVYALSAEAYAAAALGEKVLSVLRIGNQTVLATEYKVETGDTLEGRLLAEVTFGYGLVAIVYQRSPSDVPEFFPSDDIRLEAGGRLVVLATIDGLQNVEHGVSAERSHLVRILRAFSDEAVFEGARTISRVTGYNLGTARELMSRLPATLPIGLFLHQAERLVRELGVLPVDAEVVRK